MSFSYPVSFHSVPFRRRIVRQAGPCFARIAGGRGRVSAPARFARLIARARRQTHLPHAFHRGFSKLAPPGRAAPEKRLRTPLLLASYQHIFPDVKRFQEQK